ASYQQPTTAGRNRRFRGKVSPHRSVQDGMNTPVTTQGKSRGSAASERARLKEGVHIELSPRRVRTYFDHQLLADSQRVLLVWETKRPPTYWFPIEDVRMDLLAAKEAGAGSTSGTVHWRSATAGRKSDNLAWSYASPSGDLAALESHIAFY